MGCGSRHRIGLPVAVSDGAVNPNARARINTHLTTVERCMASLQSRSVPFLGPLLIPRCRRSATNTTRAGDAGHPLVNDEVSIQRERLAAHGISLPIASGSTT